VSTASIGIWKLEVAKKRAERHRCSLRDKEENVVHIILKMQINTEKLRKIFEP
jgi:hypothetical protein